MRIAYRPRAGDPLSYLLGGGMGAKCEGRARSKVTSEFGEGGGLLLGDGDAVMRTQLLKAPLYVLTVALGLTREEPSAGALRRDSCVTGRTRFPSHPLYCNRPQQAMELDFSSATRW